MTHTEPAETIPAGWSYRPGTSPIAAVQSVYPEPSVTEMYARKCLEHLEKRPMTIRELQDATGLAESGVKKALDTMYPSKLDREQVRNARAKKWLYSVKP